MKILLLEDNSFDADLIIRSIKKKDANAVIYNVNTIADAIDRIKGPQDFSAVLLDLNLPDGNGLEVLVEMRRRKLDILTIVLTSVRDEEQAVIALKTGADDYFVKDVENFYKLPDILAHNLSKYQKRTKTVKVLDLLYLEKDSDVAKTTTTYFSKQSPHLKIHTFSSKEEILDKLSPVKTHYPNYQALIMDYDLTNLDSLDLLKTIRQEYNMSIPIIILTNHGNEQIAIQALKLGADEYILKKDNYLSKLPSLIENAYKYHLLLKQKKVLEDSEKRYRLLAENAGDVIFTLDINFKFTYVSPSVNNLQGFYPNELLNKPIKSTLTFDSYERIKKSFEKLLYVNNNSGSFTPTVVELEMYKKDETKIWTEVKISILSNDDNEVYGILGVTRDISIRKKYEQELIRAKEKAEENDRLKSAFLANMSHEIRTPMNGILGFADLLKTRELDPKTINLYINAIDISGRRMLNTLNDLMDISKIEAGLVELKFSEFDLNKTLEHQQLLYKTEASKKGIQIKYLAYNVGPFLVNTDQLKLCAILGNLIKNAIKYTDNGSIEFGYLEKENTLEFFIKDTGIGIPKDAQDKIFERFVQANQDYTKQTDGSGLGLSISRSYANALGGKIWVESEEGIGSTFYFTIPYIIKSQNSNKKKDALSGKKSSPILNQYKYKGKSMLIIDDDEVSQKLLYEIFKESFGNITVANNGYKAIDLCDKENFDVILMDIKMPGLNGIETTREIRKKNKESIIIAQSAFPSDKNHEDALACGCNAYFMKPIIKKELFDFLEKKVKPSSFNE